MARFSARLRFGSATTSRWMLEGGAGMQKRVEIEYVVGKRGRRPHGCLHF
jgi:hypothetical protein